MENKPSKVSKWALILSIVIILNLLINYAISLAYEAPEYPESERIYAPLELTTDSEINQKIKEENRLEQEEWNKKWEAYQEARDEYNKNVFIILIVSGVVIFALSLLFKANYVLSTAFGLGALLDFVIASVRYWDSAQGLVKVVILLVALAILIYIAYKKFGDK